MESEKGMPNEEIAIAVRFDRTAPGSGIEAVCRVESGRAFLQWEFHLVLYWKNQIKKVKIPGDAQGTSLGKYWEMEETDGFPDNTPLCRCPESVRLRLMDMQERPVLECIGLLREEEILQSILPQPVLWKGVGNPYLYKAEAILEDEAGFCLDRVSARLALRRVELRIIDGEKQLLLNGNMLEPRMVQYTLPQTGSAVERQRLWTDDLGQLRQLGANCILWDSTVGMPEDANPFLQMCDRLGFLVFTTQEGGGIAECWEIQGGEFLRGMEENQPIPAFRGSGDSFFVPGRTAPTPLFYRYRAKWSREPFVYLAPESVKQMDSGNYRVWCYSNCGKVALYSDGRLFEFKAGELVFSFQEIPCTKPTILLTAEADGCSHSLAIHKSFTKQSPNDDIYPSFQRL